jgi:hypothetical protein
MKRCEAIKVFNRKAQVVITRMRIGHTHLTHSYHMNQLEPPRCDNCDTTVPYILYDCGLFGAARAEIWNRRHLPGKRRGEK